MGPICGSLGLVKLAKTAILSSFFAYRPFHKKSSKWVPKSINLGPLLGDFGNLEVTKELHRKSHPKVFQNTSHLGEVSGVLRTPFSLKIDPGAQEGSSRPPDPPKARKINKKRGPDTYKITNKPTNSMVNDFSTNHTHQVSCLQARSTSHGDPARRNARSD